MSISLKINLTVLLIWATVVVLISVLTPITWPWAIVIAVLANQLLQELIKNIRDSWSLRNHLRVQRVKRALRLR